MPSSIIGGSPNSAVSLHEEVSIIYRTLSVRTANRKFCVSPWWEQSKESAELMLKYGIEYGIFNLKLVPLLNSYKLSL